MARPVTGRILPPTQFAEYLAIEALNWSKLKPMRESAEDFRHAEVNARPDAPEFRMGRAAHTAILEPDRFALDCAVYRESKSRGEGARKNWQAFQDANAGRAILDEEEYDRCLGMRDAVRSHPIAGPLIAEGRAEVSIVWTDAATELECKARIDWQWAPVQFVDLKTAADVNVHRFASQAWRLGYFHQLAWYRRALASVAGVSAEAVTGRIVAVRKTAPHSVLVCEPTPASLLAADEEIDALIERFIECRATGRYPGPYETEIVPLNAPQWAFPDGGTGVDDLMIGGEDDAR